MLRFRTRVGPVLHLPQGSAHPPPGGHNLCVFLIRLLVSDRGCKLRHALCLIRSSTMAEITLIEMFVDYHQHMHTLFEFVHYECFDDKNFDDKNFNTKNLISVLDGAKPFSRSLKKIFFSITHSKI